MHRGRQMIRTPESPHALHLVEFEEEREKTREAQRKEIDDILSRGVGRCMLGVLMVALYCALVVWGISHAIAAIWK